MIQSQIAGAVVVGPNLKVLLAEQRNKVWSLPKGHIEDDETPYIAAQREVTEETGVNQLDLVKKLGTYERHKIGLDNSDDLSELKHITIFLFTTKQTELKPIDPENPSADWLPLEKVVDRLTHRKDKEFFASIQSEVAEFISNKSPK